LKRDIKVEVCAVWDTVSSVGIPKLGFIQGPAPPARLNFVHSELHDGIQHAYQALSLHEYRQPFLPIVWKASKERWNPVKGQRKGELKTLRQCWFFGYHGNVGGGENLESLAHFSLAWMIARLRRHITFDESHFWNPRLADSAWQWNHAPEKEHGRKLLFPNL
jgi:uncharacterized protein (DUF2235 family)